jgi:hypothetical protein
MIDQPTIFALCKGGMMVHNHRGISNTYRILVKETLGQSFTSWHADMTTIPQEDGNTMIMGTFPDQPALRGFLEYLWNLNITVITVERIENEN